MKKNFALAAMNPHKWYAFVIFFLIIMLNSCSKSIEPEIKIDTEENFTSLKKGPPPPSTPANSEFVFVADTIIRFNRVDHVVPAIYVMDADGSHRKLIYHDFITSGRSSFSLGGVYEASWSGNGQQICFEGRVHSGSTPPIRPLEGYTSVYTLNFSLVNGVPTASNVVRLLNGQANSINYKAPSWSPVNNEIAVVASESMLQVVPSIGGTPVTLYNAPTDNEIASPCFSPDGSKIAFYLRSTTVGEKKIIVIDRTTSNTLHNIILDPSVGWVDLDWSRTAGSTTLTFRSVILNSGGQGSVYILDLNTSSTPVAVASNGSSPTWSPDDTKIAYGNPLFAEELKGVKLLTLSNNNITTISTLQTRSLNWKRQPQ